MTNSTDRERRIRQKLKDDFPHYASRCLKIRTKAGSVELLTLNGDQLTLHAALERQRKEIGKVRALVLKGRQMGVSTYVAGRFYWRVTHGRGIRAFIQTHRDDATNNLFAMVKRMHDNCPPLVRPETQASNIKELSFGLLDGGYKVGTAKAAGVGRSDTIQLLHGSEVAFWTNAADHAAGLLQAVPQEPGTEIVLETTANGIGGLFYNLWVEAMDGRSEWSAIFLPWQTHRLYRADPPSGWVPPSSEWADYQAAHDLKLDQLYWAWRKNVELARASGEPSDQLSWRFRQEYPATWEEAFQVSGGRSFINGMLVLNARKPKDIGDESYAAQLLGIDVSGGGADDTVVIDRRGRLAGTLVYDRWNERDAMVTAGRIARILDEVRPDQAFIDIGGGYSAIYYRLCELGFDAVLTPVDFGGKPYNTTDYANTRAEIWGLMRDWLQDPGGVVIPQEELMARALVAPEYKLNSNRQVVLESKEDIKSRLGFSPDDADALATTFKEPVTKGANGETFGCPEPESDWDIHAV